MLINKEDKTTEVSRQMLSFVLKNINAIFLPLPTYSDQQPSCRILTFTFTMTYQIFQLGQSRKLKRTEFQNIQLKMSKKILFLLANVCPGYI